MANTFIKIASTTVGSGGASNITFSSIPSTYTDLCLKLSVRSNRSASEDGLGIAPNVATSGYTYRILSGNGSNASSVATAYEQIWAARVQGNTTTSNTFTSSEFYFPNYAGSNYKSASAEFITENNATEAYAYMSALLWSNTAAITSISLSAGAYSWLTYSTAYLYGVKNA